VKIEVDEIRIVLTNDEARIIVEFMRNWDDEDPYGMTAQVLGMDIDIVINVCDKFRKGLCRRLD
jgi:hypothetical protein